MNYKSIIGLLMLWVSSFSLVAQAIRYQFTPLSVEQGLSHNQVNCVLKDSKGFVWIGTMSGLNRYDGYTFKIFRHDIRDSTSLSNNYVKKLFEDPQGRIWVHTRNGTNIYDSKSETFHRQPEPWLKQYAVSQDSIADIIKDNRGNYWFVPTNHGLLKYNPTLQRFLPLTHSNKDTTTLSSNAISTLQVDSKGDLWIIHTNGVIEKMDASTNKISYRNYTLKNKFYPEVFSYRLLIDNEDDLWMYLEEEVRGVFYFNTREKIFLHLHQNASLGRLSTNLVRGIVQDTKGYIWIGTDHGGINVLDKKSFSIQELLHSEEDAKSLSQNSIYSLYKDNFGIIWVGTYKMGLCYYHENNIKFPLFRHQTSNPRSIPYDDVIRFVEDAKGNLWIGTNGGGLIYYDRGQEKFTQFVNNPANPNSISNDVIVSLCIDHEQKLWIGTYHGGLDCYDGKKFIHFKHNPAIASTISDNQVWEIFEDSQQNLWVGTLKGGLNLFNRATQTFSHYRLGGVNSIHSDYISDIIEDREGNVWIGTAIGIDVLSRKTGRFEHYENESKQPGQLSNNNVNSIMEDSRGLIWVGTHEGLNLFDKKKKSFTTYREEDGLPSNTILTILEDNHKNLWMSTPNGLTNLIIEPGRQRKPVSFRAKNYDESDGLQGKVFNEYAAYKTRANELIFGGAHGFNIFHPENIGQNLHKPTVALTDFQIFNKSIHVGEEINGQVILEKAIGEVKEITIPYNQNVFSIEFAALSFIHPEKTKYRYILEGFNHAWLTTDGKDRKVTYTNTDPGEYTFRVKASNSDGVWNDKELSIKIIVLPPFWRTHTAFFIYFLLIIGILHLARRLVQKIERMKYRIEQERQEAQRMHELDKMKIKFFTNVSHEFRTPLSLIISPLDKIIAKADNTEQQTQLSLVQRNARRLLNLVNQLLDFRKMESHELKLITSRDNIISFIDEITNSFSDLSEKKNIKLSFYSSIPELETYFDKDKLERILFNLLSNAVKFTSQNGSVEVKVRAYERQDLPFSEQNWIEIAVKDTGIGIPEDKQEKIFERFFQNDIPTSMVNQGSGIGLAITKEFVKLHGGSIIVESKPGHGSTFLVHLPIQPVIDTIPIVLEEETTRQVKHTDPILPLEKEAGAKPSVLLVEDNEDLRFYLKENLKDQYQILEAENGKEGWEQILGQVPDLVVSDIMMPTMNGIELCRNLKLDPRTSHIPIILLTARASDEQKLEGFEIGADDYITKPFSFDILLVRIKNLIAKASLRQKAYQKQFEFQASELAISSLDEKLMQKAHELVEKNISNADFSVEELSREIGMSRVYLYKKLLSLTGKTPIEFIRVIRLQRAAQLLEKSQLTISEIAYQVGFNDPRYFTKYFKIQFDTLPSQYLAHKRKNNVTS